ncbi:hypothetical protein O181_018985 [Austropuccinia psidii MF-1]|uniref:Uncharacterized protein n=1 Tax=Austropuccinia psidii MF-1 TaxID=1389203 RepID=A0A9Q3C9Q1_9BASI|nr:hypothetical protein [Austropuccinia psidii MF-1]
MIPWAQISWGFRVFMGPIKWPMDQTLPTWPGPLEMVQDHQASDLHKVEGEVLVVSSKLTELTESFPSVLCGSGILSQLASSRHFDPAQTYDGYKAVEKPCHCTGIPASNVRRYLWSKKDGPFGKELPVLNAPTPDGTSEYSNLTGSRQRDVAGWTIGGGPIPVGGRPIYSSSELPICRINTEGVVKQLRQISGSPPDPDSECSDELDAEEVEVVHNSSGQKSSTSTSYPHTKIFQSQIIPSTPRAFQPILHTIPATLPPSSPKKVPPPLGLP